MAFATIEDLLAVDETLQDYGVLEWDTELTKAEADVVKILKVRWWPSFIKNQSRTLDADSYEINVDLLDPTQWTDVTCYYALAFYILPKLSKFEETADRFRNMMEYYSQRFDALMDLEMRSGVRYDINQDEQFESDETVATSSLRLVR